MAVRRGLVGATTAASEDGMRSLAMARAVLEAAKTGRETPVNIGF